MEITEARNFAQNVVDVLARAEEVKAMAATHEELTLNAATLTAEIEQKRETLANLNSEIAARESAAAALQSKYGKLERAGDLEEKIKEQTAKLKELNNAIESARQKFAAA